MSSSRKRLSEGSPAAFRLQDADLMEEEEQAVLVEAMERAAARQRHYSKALLSFFGVLLGVLYFYFAACQLIEPWTTPHQAHFSGRLRQLSVAAAELAGAATALLAVAGVVAYPGRQARGSWRSLLAFAALLAALLSAFWSVGVWRVAVHERAALPALWRLLWLPVVPPAYVGLMALAAGVMRATDADVERLRRLRYAYKRA
ncbi:Arginine biosynthesis bifunctional chloroplastic [Micractinium conductrix]|uniref:Arginine biosynthesis bifunctional chloroplastic n=1 Tax=Micractinium conductrix TaxID=554055 RepID=A0A2P6VBR7_9CHLO|nr:Arginine biosynthesis bifunctional chloroplastic [Micractinium conductrix]|eukprot:PSC71526.1 Arginine biosynthesis bifunctional chloroplastic [Micractinium conductrix]